MTTAADKKKAAQREIVWGSAKTVAEKENRGYLAVVLPAGLTQFRFKNADRNYDLDIIPYPAGAHNPEVEEGHAAYRLTYQIHQSVGPDEKSYVCLANNSPKERCPRCEQINEMLKRGQITRAEHKEMDAKVRQLFRVRNREEKDKGIQLLEDQFFMGGLGQQISQAINALDADDPRCQFYRLSAGGYYLRVATQNVPWANPRNNTGGTRVRPTRVDFIEREQALKDDWYDLPPDLEELVRRSRLSYDDFKKICYGKVDPKASNSEDPRRDGKTPPAEEEAPPAAKKAAPPAAKKAAPPAEEEAPPAAKKAAPPPPEPEDEPSTSFKPGDLVTFANDEDQTLEGVIKRIDEIAEVAIIMIDGVKYKPALDALTLKPPTKEDKAESAEPTGFTVGGYVKHPMFGRCKITKVVTNDAGAVVMLTLEDSDEDLHSKIDPKIVKPWKEESKEDEAPPAKKRGGM